MLKAQKLAVSLFKNNKVLEKEEIVEKIISSSFVPVGNKVAISIIRTSEILEEYYNLALEPFEITTPQVEIIKILYFSNKKNFSQEKIAKLTFTSKANISSHLIKLEKKGLINREINPKNKREKLITLTELGKDKLLELTDKYEINEFKGLINKIDAENLVKSLSVFRKNVQNLNNKNKIKNKIKK
jgi:DNA-binding MarR family transcriptional regulator